MSNPDITFYANQGCPYCPRVYIALNELGLPFNEVLINLAKPREEWYLTINPSGKRPAIKYSDDEIPEMILTDSIIIAQFLCDTHPSHLLPASLGTPTAPVIRARISLFVDAWTFKEEAVKAAGERVQKHIEPLLETAGPFLGESKDFTFAEVSMAPFMMRLSSLLETKYLQAALQEVLENLSHFPGGSRRFSRGIKFSMRGTRRR